MNCKNISRLMDKFGKGSNKGQSLVELALVLPALIIMILAIAEGALFIGRYMDLLDLTREAAREAARDDPFTPKNGVEDTTSLGGLNDCGYNGDPNNPIDSANVNFYFKAACLFSSPKPQNDNLLHKNGVCESAQNCSCQDDKFCNGINHEALLDLSKDDVVISVYTIDDKTVTTTWPNKLGHNPFWALSTDGNLTYQNGTKNVPNDVWKKDCQGNIDNSASPYYDKNRVDSQISSVNYGAPQYRGYVAVETFYCYKSSLAILLFNPLRVHVYTLMPLPNAQPTPTALPTETSTPVPAP